VTLLLDVFVPLLVVFIMTVVGLDLRLADFLRVREYPVLVPGIVVGQWIALMLVAGLVGRLLDLPHAIAAGALLLAAAPVAALSNYYTQLARGHLALAVTVTAVSTALAPLATPLVASLGFRWFMGAASAFELPPAKVVQQTVVGLLLPLVAGMLLRHRAEAWAARWRARLQALSLLAVVAVFAFVVVDQFATIRDQFALFLAASVAFTLAMLGIGMLVARVVAPARDDRRALLWSFPARNVAVATLIATAAVGQVAMASFLAVLFATQVALLVPVALWLHRRSDRSLPA
jgi:BASS family bile acid:Na+ symporter